MKLEREKLDLIKDFLENAENIFVDKNLYVKNIKIKYNPKTDSFSYYDIDPIMTFKVEEEVLGYNPLNGLTVNPFKARTQEDFLDDSQFDYLLNSDAIKELIEKEFIPEYNDKVSKFETAYFERYKTLRSINHKNDKVKSLQEIVDYFLKRK